MITQKWHAFKRRNSRSPLLKKKGTGRSVFLLLLLFVPLFTNAASPWADLSFKLEAFLFGPPLLVKHLVMQGVGMITKQTASLFGTQEKTANQLTSDVPNSSLRGPSPMRRAGGEAIPQEIASPLDKLGARNDSGVQKIIIKEKEIIREVIVKDNGATTIVKESAIPPSDEKLSALKSELTDSFTSRINKLVGGFGFNTNRFDDLFVQKQLELSGKLTQPASVASSPITFSSSITSKDISATSLSLSSTLTVSGTATSTISGPLKIAGGLTAGSGNVQIIDSTGKIPALSSTYFATLPSLFSSIGNASSTVQFSASTNNDVLSFEATGGLLTISFNSTTKKITFSAPAPTLLSVLQQGADASTFTGTAKIGGLTITSSGNLTLTGALAISGSATSTLAGPLDIGSGKFTVLSSSGNTTIQGALTAQGTLTAASSLFQVNSSGFALLPFGTSTTPSLSFTGDTDTGIFGKDNNILAFGTGGIERMRIDGSGNIGIGTISPAGRLDVGGGQLVVTSAGNVGIGTTSPTYPLEVKGTVAATVANFSNTTGGSQITFTPTTNDQYRIGAGVAVANDFGIVNATRGTTPFYITGGASGGNVGIGTTAPGYLLDVKPTTNVAQLRLQQNNATDGSILFVDSTTGNLRIQRIQAGATSDYVTIANGGNVGIGTTSPNIAGRARAVTISHGGSEWGSLEFQRTSFGAGQGIGGVDIYNNSTELGNMVWVYETASDSSKIQIATKATGVAMSQKIGVDGDGNVSVSMPGTQNLIAACHATNGTSSTSGSNNLVDCSGAPSDIAEWYDTTSEVELGDIVIPSPQKGNEFNYSSGIGSVTDKNGNITEEVPLPGATTSISVLTRASSPYQSNILGIVSIAPYQTFGEDVQKYARHPQRIALTGRVPVKVSTENGPITIGDRITSSSIPGVGMKATKSGVTGRYSPPTL